VKGVGVNVLKRDRTNVGVSRRAKNLLLQYKEVKEVGVGVLRRDKQNAKYSTVWYVYCICTVY